MIQCRLPAVEMSGRKRASSGMQMSLVQKQDMYCKVPEWAREFLPDIDKPWKQKGPYGCRRLEPSGWNCHLCGCEGSSSHVFGMPHLTKCYWDKYPDGHEALEDSSDKAQEPGPILAIEDRSPGASPSAAPTASSVACALPNGEGFSSAFLRWWSHREHVKDGADASEQAQLQRAMMNDEQHDDEDDEKPRRDTRRGRSRHRSRSQRRQFRQHHQFQSRRPSKPRVAPAGKHGFKVRFVDDPDQKVYNMRKGAIAECFRRSVLPIPDWIQAAREKAFAVAERRIPHSDDDDAHGHGSDARFAIARDQ